MGNSEEKAQTENEIAAVVLDVNYCSTCCLIPVIFWQFFCLLRCC